MSQVFPPGSPQSGQEAAGMQCRQDLVSPETHRAYLRAVGRRVLGEANDLKRTPEALAQDLGFDREVIRAVIAGEAEERVVQEVLQAMAARYPVALLDLLVAPDDTRDGVRLMSAADSAASRRIIPRPDRSGSSKPYYEYRDTAMSRTAPFRPEWIKQLRHVSSSEPSDPDVAYNRGHLLHQFTFFLGPVNFYWELNGRRYSRELDDGDSSYITPFVPHSFTARRLDREAIIVAVGYAASLRSARTDLMYLSSDEIAELAGDLRQPWTASRARLRRHLAAESLSEKQLESRLISRGMNPLDATRVAREGPRCNEEVRAAAAALGLRAADIATHTLLPDEEVVVQRRAEGARHPFPDERRPAYRMTRLARSKHQPYLKAFEVEVLEGDGAAYRHSLHEYVYNCGATTVRLQWADQHQAILEPGASAYVRPFVCHGFRLAGDGASGRLLVVRIPGLLTDEVTAEVASLAPHGRSRTAGESLIWF